MTTGTTGGTTMGGRTMGTGTTGGGLGTTTAAPMTGGGVTGTRSYKPSLFQRLAHPGHTTASPTTTGAGTTGLGSRRSRRGRHNLTDTTATTGGLTGATASTGHTGVGGVGGREKLSRTQRRIPSLGDKIHGMAKTLVGTVTLRHNKVVEGEAMMQGRDVKTSRWPGRRSRRVV